VLSHLVQMYEENDHEHRSQIQACFHERDKNLNRNSLGKRISVKPSFLVPSVSKIVDPNPDRTIDTLQRMLVHIC
jgi:hypothetical protein